MRKGDALARWIGMSFFVLAAFLQSAGCGDDSGGGAADAALVDAAQNDDAAVFQDSALVDAAVGDAQVEDAHVSDGGESDASHAVIPIDIYVVGDDSAKTIDDGYSGQTPTNYVIGFSRVDLMKSADDQNPVTVFDFGANYVEVDMSTETKVGTADLFDIPAGVYNYGRVQLVMARFDVDVTVHVTIPPAAVAGLSTVTAALSDCTIDGQARAQGWTQYEFRVPSYPSFTKVGTMPDLPDTAAGTIVKENGKMWLVFPINPALTVAPVPNVAHRLTITYDTYESFRWEDQSTSGYQTGVFDSDQDGNTEPLTNVGATDYHITVE